MKFLLFFFLLRIAVYISPYAVNLKLFFCISKLYYYREKLLNMMMAEFTVEMLMMMELKKGKEFTPGQVGADMRGSGRMG